MSESHGTVHWTELMTRDVESAKRYYEEVCGWSFTNVPMGAEGADYTLGMKDGLPVIGMMHFDDENQEPFWMSYFAVDDVDAAVKDAVAAGGTLLREPFDVPDTGRIAIVTDPDGALFGLMTPAPMDGG